MGWTEEPRSNAVQLWAEGLSASQIARNNWAGSPATPLSARCSPCFGAALTPSRAGQAPVGRPARGSLALRRCALAHAVERAECGHSDLEPLRLEDGEPLRCSRSTSMCKYPIGDPNDANFAFWRPWRRQARTAPITRGWPSRARPEAPDRRGRTAPYVAFGGDVSASPDDKAAASEAAAFCFAHPFAPSAFLPTLKTWRAGRAWRELKISSCGFAEARPLRGSVFSTGGNLRRSRAAWVGHMRLSRRLQSLHSTRGSVRTFPQVPIAATLGARFAP